MPKKSSYLDSFSSKQYKEHEIWYQVDLSLNLVAATCFLLLGQIHNYLEGPRWGNSENVCVTLLT